MSVGGDLASVKDHSENERIKAVIIESGISDQVVWIGGNDLKQEGTFECSLRHRL